MRNQYVFELGRARLSSGIGNKAENLRFLIKKGFQTPPSWVCTWDAYLRYLEDEQGVTEHLASELSERLDWDRDYAVRSSANTEDSLDHSFAGQFKSLLGVRGLNEVVRAVRLVWAATHSEAVQSYLSRNGIRPGDLRMAIVIQEMVPQVVSGVSFSKNPMTGLDEVVVEAVEGSGEALVREGVTPLRWVNKWGEWTEQPDGEEIDSTVIDEVVRQTKAIARIYGDPVDLEWVYDGDAVHWVQLRAITSPEVELYSNRISSEVFPGIIKPLVWSVNVPLVNCEWVRLFTELIGPNDIDPHSLAKSLYYRAYFNMGAIGRIFELLGMPRETLELLMGIEGGGSDRPSFKPTRRTYALLPRILWFVAKKLRFARKIEAFIPRMEREYASFDLDQVYQLDERELLDEIDRLYGLTQRVAYYNIVTPLLMQVYNAILKSQLARTGIDFERLDVTAGLKELERYQPNVHLARLNGMYRDLGPELQMRIRESSYDQFSRLSGIEPLQRGVAQFLDQFGHLSDSGNDFSSVPWRENPDLIVKMMTAHSDPVGRYASKLIFTDLKIPAMRRPVLRWVYSRARQFRLYREAIGSLYTFGYGLFRVYFLALGDHFFRRGITGSREGIFYLQLDEVREIVENDGAADSYQQRIADRKREICESQDIVPPTIVYGDQPVAPAPESSNRLQGTPTSRGCYTGPVRVVQNLGDFEKLKPGDVLVIPYSDVGWTPLFTKAGAVVAESGGILSHSSIIAREYGIPAVVSVSGACCLEDNTLVTVDGYGGGIFVRGSDRDTGAILDP